MSDTPHSSQPEQKNYFVDEAGDPVLFGSRGKVLVGTEGCSRFFILGVADIPDPQRLGQDIERLRAQLLADPYFKDVPSMQPQAKRTALLFHAKDDPAEVRREVLKLLVQQPIRFSAIARDKLSVLEYVRKRNEAGSQYHFKQNDLYDFMVRRLFKERLHKHGAYQVVFAKRGNSDRTQALTEALERTRQRFAREHGIEVSAKLHVLPSSPVREPALQAVDYFLWAVQRTFERQEDRFLQLLWPQCSLVIDADDTRAKGYGTYYTQKKPLTAAALKKAEGYRSGSPR